MLNLFKIIHIYIDSDSLFWIYMVNKKIKKKGVYDLKNGYENLKMYFIDILNVKSLYFFYFKVSVSTTSYKISVLPFVNSYLNVDTLKNISNSIFSKKYLNFDQDNHQFFYTKHLFNKPIILVALNKDIYRNFINLNLGKFDFYFDAIEVLNKMEVNESKIFSFNGSYYYFEFYEKKLIDINIFHNKRALRNIEVYEMDSDYLSVSTKVIFSEMMS